MNDPEYIAWTTEVTNACAAAGLPVPAAHVLEHAWDDGVEPEDFPEVVHRYAPGFKRPISGTVEDALARARPAGE